MCTWSFSAHLQHFLTTVVGRVRGKDGENHYQKLHIKYQHNCLLPVTCNFQNSFFLGHYSIIIFHNSFVDSKHLRNTQLSSTCSLATSAQAYQMRAQHIEL